MSAGSESEGGSRHSLGGNDYDGTKSVGQSTLAEEDVVAKPEGQHLQTNPQPSAEDFYHLGHFHLEEFGRTGSPSDLEQMIDCFSRAVTLTPEDHPDMSWRLGDLAASYGNRFRRLGELADLEKALEYDSRALVMTPDDHPSVSRRLANLAVSYNDRFERLGELADLEKAIGYFSRALESTPDDHLDMPERLADLGVSYNNRFYRLGELDDLEKSIEYKSRAFGLLPDDHPDMPIRLTNLAVSFGDRFQHLGELEDLEKAIEYAKRAFALTPDDDLSMPSRLANLGVFCGERFRRLGDISDLEESIDYKTRALALIPEDHPHLSGQLIGLGLSYTDRFRRLDELADLEKSIEYKSRALALTPDGHPDLSRRTSTLGMSYGDRYYRLGGLADLERSIEYYSRALELAPDGHPEISDRLAELGVAYSDRFRRLGELVDLEKALECDSRALALTPSDHPSISFRLAHQATCYGARFGRLNELEDLEKAVECHSRAFALTPDDDPEVSRRLADLGSIYADRYRFLGELVDLEKSIEYKLNAFISTPDDHPDMPWRLQELGRSYHDQFQQTSEITDLEKSLEYNSRAIASTPDGHPDFPTRCFNYARSLLSRYEQTGDSAHLDTSLEYFRKASQLLIGAPRERFQYAIQWANYASYYISLNPMEAFQTTIDILPQLIWLGATTSQRYQDLSMAESLAVNACFAAIQSSEYSCALEWLEQARCVVWNQSLMLRSPLDQLHASHPGLASQLEAVANELHSFSFDNITISGLQTNSVTPEQAGQRRRHLASEYNDLLTQTRQLVGFENFLRPTKTDDFVPAVRNGPFAVINCHTYCCDALIIFPGGDESTHLRLPNFNEDKARRARSDLDISLKQKHLRQRGVRRRHQLGHEDRIEGVLQALWSDIVKPVLDELGYMADVSKGCLPHITWCPTGSLSFLPLHAAGDYSQPGSKVFDYVVSSYAPTLTALLASSHSDLKRSCRMLGVGQAATPGHTPLPGTTKELSHVKAHAYNNTEYSELVDAQATTTSILDAMEENDWVHLACHAHQNVDDPTKSGFFLHDGTLDLASINRRSFKNKGLAFLSACQTATGDERLPDEAIHLASGMLMAGYPSVIATMWSVVDEDAPFVADGVYAQLMKNGKLDNGEAGRALHDAIAGLREKVGEKEFARWAPYIHIGS